MTKRSNSPAVPRPLFDKVLVKKVPEVDMTEGGIIIPEVAREKPSLALVLAVGEGQRTYSLDFADHDVAPDDFILVPQNSGQEIDFMGEKFHTIPAEDILAILEI